MEANYVRLNDGGGVQKEEKEKILWKNRITLITIANSTYNLKSVSSFFWSIFQTMLIDVCVCVICDRHNKNFNSIHFVFVSEC